MFCGAAVMLAAFPVFAQQTGTAKAVQINKEPLLEFASLVKYRVAGKDVDLSQPFRVILEGVLDKDGKLDRQNSRFVLSEGDEQTAELAKMGIEAFSDSGWFAYARNLGAERVRITLAQDQTNFNAVLESEFLNADRAKTAASGLNMLIALSKSQITGQDEKTLLNGLSAPTVNGKNFVLNFALPKQIAQDMINRGLSRAATRSTASE